MSTFLNCCNILTGGITIGCSSNAPGVTAIWVTDHCNVTSITESNGTITAMTLASGAEFFKFGFTKNSGLLEYPLVKDLNNGNSSYDQKVSLFIPRMELAKRNNLKLLAVNTLAVIVLDKNGIYWYVGRTNGADVTEMGISSGATSADRNGYTIAITANEPQQPYVIDSTIIAGIVDEVVAGAV